MALAWGLYNAKPLFNKFPPQKSLELSLQEKSDEEEIAESMAKIHCIVLATSQAAIKSVIGLATHDDNGKPLKHVYSDSLKGLGINYNMEASFEDYKRFFEVNIIPYYGIEPRYNNLFNLMIKNLSEEKVKKYKENFDNQFQQELKKLCKGL